MRRLSLPILLLAVLFGGATMDAAPAPVLTSETIQDRKGFIPYRKYYALPGKVIGLLVSNVREKMSHEGRSGPPNAMGFSHDVGSYRWMYTPANGKALINQLRVKVGENGNQIRIFPSLNMANPDTVKQWKIQAPYALVEVEVNDGLGAPAQEGFVATKMKRLDGTKEYPLNVAKVVEELKDRYEKDLKKLEDKISQAMEQSKEDAIGKNAATGPREKKTLMYLTWVSDQKRLRMHFRTTITDGAYKFTQGGARPIRPFPLPPPPGANPVKQPPAARRGGAFPPPPPVRARVRYGTAFGIELGYGYEVSSEGALKKILELPIESFKKVIPPPPAVGFPQRPIDPVRPRPNRP